MGLAKIAEGATVTPRPTLPLPTVQLALESLSSFRWNHCPGCAGIRVQLGPEFAVAELCRKYGISDATYYNWKAKFGGMTVSDAQRLKALEAENAKLKRLLAESMLDNAALKDVVSRKW